MCDPTSTLRGVVTVFLFRPPHSEFVQEVIDRQRETEFTYDGIGQTIDSRCPPKFSENQFSAIIGNGAESFARARRTLCDYRMLQLGWIHTVGRSEPVAEGAIVCTLARQFPIYSLNVARIVYVDDGTTNRFGFAYGTLAEYPLVGEERFSVTLNENSGDVVYTIFSFSRPKSLLLWPGLPLIRKAQRKFCRDSIAVMRVACAT